MDVMENRCLEDQKRCLGTAESGNQERSDSWAKRQPKAGTAVRYVCSHSLESVGFKHWILPKDGSGTDHTSSDNKEQIKICFTGQGLIQ